MEPSPQQQQTSSVTDVTKRPFVYVRLRNVPVEFRRPSEEFQTHVLHSKLAPHNVKCRVDTGATKPVSSAMARFIEEQDQQQLQLQQQLQDASIQNPGCVSILEDAKTVVVSAPAKCHYAHLPPLLHYFPFDGCFSAMPPSEALNMMPLLRDENAKQQQITNTNKYLPPPAIKDEELFEKSVRPIMDAVTQLRIPASLICYGMTSSGKTRSLFGSEAQHVAAANITAASDLSSFNKINNNNNNNSNNTAKMATKESNKFTKSNTNIIVPTSVYNASLAISRDPSNNEANPGLVHLACNRFLEEYPHGICISFFEVYNEKLKCLFTGSEVQPVLTPEGMVFKNLSRVIIKSNEELRKKINEGMKIRKQASTIRNDHSSRSHAILQMFPILDMMEATAKKEMSLAPEKHQQQHPSGTPAKPTSKHGAAATTKEEKAQHVVTKTQFVPVISERVRLTVVDLAGSERLSAASPAQQRESAQINLALSNLGRVIQSLSQIRNHHQQHDEKKMANVGGSSQQCSGEDGDEKEKENTVDKQRNVDPECRASALTWALRDELQFKTAVSFLITISPMTIHANETLSSLRFAGMLRQIRTVIKINTANSNHYQNHELKIASEQLARNFDLQRQATNPLQLLSGAASSDLITGVNPSPSKVASSTATANDLASPGPRNPKQLLTSPLSNNAAGKSSTKKKPLSTLLAEKRAAQQQQEKSAASPSAAAKNNNNKARSKTQQREETPSTTLLFSPQKENIGVQARISVEKETRGTSPFVVEEEEEHNNNNNNAANNNSDTQQNETAIFNEQQQEIEQIVLQMQYESVRRQQHDDEEEIISFVEPEDDSLQVVPVSGEEVHAPNFEPSPSRKSLSSAKQSYTATNSQRESQSSSTSAARTDLELDKVEEDAAIATAQESLEEQQEEQNVQISFQENSTIHQQQEQQHHHQTPVKQQQQQQQRNKIGNDVAIITSANIDVQNLANVIIDQHDEELENNNNKENHHHLRLYSASTPILNLSEFDLVVVGTLASIRKWWVAFKEQQHEIYKNLIVSCIVLAAESTSSSSSSSSCFVLSRSSSILVDHASLSPEQEQQKFSSPSSVSPVSAKCCSQRRHHHHASPSKWSWWGQFWSPCETNSANVSSAKTTSYLAKITRARQTESFFVSDEDRLAFALQHGDGFDLLSDNNVLQLRFYLFDAAHGPIQTAAIEKKGFSPSPSRKNNNNRANKKKFYLPPVSAELLKESLKNNNTIMFQQEEGEQQQEIVDDQEQEQQEETPVAIAVISKTVETNCNTARSKNFVVPHSENNIIVVEANQQQNEKDESNESSCSPVAIRNPVRQAFSITSTAASPCKQQEHEGLVNVAEQQKSASVESSAAAKSLSAPGTEPSPKRPSHQREEEEQVEEQQRETSYIEKNAIDDLEQTKNTMMSNRSVSNNPNGDQNDETPSTPDAIFTSTTALPPVIRAQSTQNARSHSSAVSLPPVHHHLQQHQRSNSAVLSVRQHQETSFPLQQSQQQQHNSGSSSSSSPSSSSAASNAIMVMISVQSGENNVIAIESTSTSINPSAANSKQNSLERNHHHQSQHDEPEPLRPYSSVDSPFYVSGETAHAATTTSRGGATSQQQQQQQQQQVARVSIPADVFLKNARRSVSFGDQNQERGNSSIARMDEQQQCDGDGDNNNNNQTAATSSCGVIPPLQLPSNHQRPLVFGSTNFTRSFSAASSSSYYSKPRKQHQQKSENQTATQNHENDDDDDQYEDIVDDKNESEKQKQSVLKKSLSVTYRSSSNNNLLKKTKSRSRSLLKNTQTTTNSSSRFSSLSQARSSVSLAVSEEGMGAVDENFLFDGYQSKQQNFGNTNNNKSINTPRSSSARGGSKNQQQRNNKSVTPRGGGSARRRFATPLDMIKKMSQQQQQQQTPNNTNKISSASPASFFRKIGARLQSLLPKNNEPPQKASQLSNNNANSNAQQQEQQQQQQKPCSAEAQFIQNGKTSLKHLVETRQQKPVNNSSSAHLFDKRKREMSNTFSQHNSPKPMMKRHMSHLSP